MFPSGVPTWSVLFTLSINYFPFSSHFNTLLFSGKRKRNEQMNIPQPPPPPPPQLQHMLIPQQQPPPQQLPGHLLGNPMLHRPPGPPGPPPGASHMIPVHGRLPNVHNLPPNSVLFFDCIQFNVFVIDSTKCG